MKKLTQRSVYFPNPDDEHFSWKISNKEMKQIIANIPKQLINETLKVYDYDYFIFHYDKPIL